jgi:hypothetical protein
MNPGQHLIGVEVCAWCYVFWVVEQRGVKVHFIGEPVCSKEHRRTAFPTKATCVSQAAFIADRHVSNELPATILLPDPRRKRRGCCAAAALAMAVTNPIGFPDELKLASTTEASPSDRVLQVVAHDHDSSALAIDAEAVHRVDWQAALVDAPSRPPGIGGDRAR